MKKRPAVSRDDFARADVRVGLASRPRGVDDLFYAVECCGRSGARPGVLFYTSWVAEPASGGAGCAGWC